MFEYIIVLINTVGVMAICTLLYGLMQRRIQNFVIRRLGLGLVLGCSGILMMAQPIVLGPGLQADARGAFIGMAAAFGGPIAAVTAGVLNGVARVIIGGSGTIAGVLVIAASGAGGLLWRYRVGKARKRIWTDWLSISILCLGPSALTLVAVASTAWRTSIFLGLVIGLVVFIFGKMLETEQRRGRRERQLTKEASTDCLTGLPNRRSLMNYARELEAERVTGVLFLMLDVDHFKKINDEFGHDAGDIVLQEIGSAIRRTVRATDFAARVGGEEFAILVHTKNADAGRLVAERFRKALQIPYGTTQLTRVSIGGFFFEQAPFNYSKGYQRADQALYASKIQGRDRVTLSLSEERDLELAS
ncbi:GGDEF domain-containing protein [Paracoccus benzoatiresistens]|uniref:diguanylate cyclase n=1 Tax=Paracoccus benzoatiresistens TaxID=2997341 RepID=A0ABT4JD20_9RHOB|nr:diguanylate cyclase [Paracoccus sp. EF6]MCZ0964482.1 diguanylate cyclase [Paracoccus sp. EF6]